MQKGFARRYCAELFADSKTQYGPMAGKSFLQ